jgi:hypothetical protein
MRLRAISVGLVRKGPRRGCSPEQGCPGMRKEVAAVMAVIALCPATTQTWVMAWHRQ